jgi:HK97 family phage major capsid protein
MMLKIDHDILEGTIALNGYDGIKTLATQFAVPGAYKLNAGDIANNKDVLRCAIAQLNVANYTPDYIILNPVAAMEMDLERDKNGEYIMAPFTSINGQVLAGIPIIQNNGVGADEFVVGNFKKAKLFVRKDAELKVWEQNDTDAIAQLKTFTLYMRAALRIKTPDYLAFVKGTFTAGKALLNVI